MRTPRRVLVVGGGAREHALAWRLGLDEGVERVLAAPGSAGMADVAAAHPEVAAGDADAIVRLCREAHVELVVVGPEAPLVAGLADRLEAEEIPVFGPSAAAARLEGSKGFCREVATAAGVPMAEGAAFDDTAGALDCARSLGAPVVVKADGLAAGKGVTVCATPAEAERAIRAAVEERVFGEAGARVVVERALAGREASVMAMCDGAAALALPAARDHKRVGDGDTGPNTGGMGACSPVPDLDDAAATVIVERFHRPVLAELARRGIAFRGALYAGLMLTAEGAYLLEFNVRFGDPEAQAVLPRLDAPLAALLLAAAEGRLADAADHVRLADGLVPARRQAAVALVLAAAGYPGTPLAGDEIRGIEDARAAGALVFHAGTRVGPGGRFVTAGGRVLSVVATGPDLAAARAAAYHAADRIDFAGRQLRRDIGLAPTTALAESRA